MKDEEKVGSYIMEGTRMNSGFLDFIKTIGRLKKIRRKGWISFVGVGNPESVADHTFRTAVLTMFLSDLKCLDTEKLVRMALLHDVHEALIGDYNHSDRKRIDENELRNREVEAINSVFSFLPGNLREKYILLSLEFQKQETEEAKYVRQIDQLEMIVQALEYEEEGYCRKKLQAFWDHAEEELEDTDIKKLFEYLKIEKSNRM